MLQHTIDCHDFRVLFRPSGVHKTIQWFPIAAWSFPDNRDGGCYAKENILGLFHSPFGRSRFLSSADLGRNGHSTYCVCFLVDRLPQRVV
jgi:hypothetical protein